jgi:hypothetical protein
MKKCLLCKKETNDLYGDNQYGKSFCTKCYDENVCCCCKRINIIIYTNDNIINNHNKFIPPKDDEYINILYLSFYGKIFKLYCKECFDSGEPYKEELIVDEKYGCEVPEFDSELEDNMNENQEDEYTNIDAYYVRRGKHDLY